MLTIKEPANIIKRHKEQQQQTRGTQFPVTPDEVRARQLLQDLVQVHSEAYNERKEKWFKEHPTKKLFEPTLQEVERDMGLEEWIWYFVTRIAMTPHERYFEILSVGGTDEEARLEKEKTDLEILQDYERLARLRKCTQYLERRRL